jgi:replicative DNA helicase
MNPEPQNPVNDGMEKWLVSLLLQSETVRDFTEGRLNKSDFQNAHYGHLYHELTSLPRNTVWEVPVLADKLGFGVDSSDYIELENLRVYSFDGRFDCKKAAKVVNDAVDRLLNVAKKRFIHGACIDLANMAEIPTTDLSIIEADLAEMQKKLAVGRERKSWSEHTMDWLELLEYRFEHRHDRQTLGTGLPSIDAIIGEFGIGHLVVIKARFKVGKSAFVLGIINKTTVENKVPGLVISLEMTRTEWIDRIFAHRSGVDSQRIITGMLLEKDFPKITGQASMIKEAPLYIEDRDCLLLPQIVSLMRFYKITADIQYVVLDHANLVLFPNSKSQQHENLGSLTAMFKGVAKQLGITVFCLFQTNEDGTTFGSKTMVPANVDKDIHITVPDGKKPDETNIRYVSVELNRHGRTGGVKSLFDGATMTFRELAAASDDEPKNGRRRQSNDE